MRVRLFDLLICFLAMTAGVTLSHLLVANSLDYASYWWTNSLYWPDADWTLQALFLLLPLPAAFAGAAIMRRLDWFRWAAAGAVVVHDLMRLVDAGAGTAMVITGALRSVWYWLLPALVYGLAAGVGAAVGLAAGGFVFRRSTPTGKVL